MLQADNNRPDKYSIKMRPVVTLTLLRERERDLKRQKCKRTGNTKGVKDTLMEREKVYFLTRRFSGFVRFSF
jgi:hypothetical protein